MLSTLEDVTTVDIAHRSTKTGEAVRVTVIAEPTDTPGLVVTPDTRGGRLTGFWNITHAGSGLVIPIEQLGGSDIYTARRVADELGTIGVDWTGDQDAIAAAMKVDGMGEKLKAAIKRGRYPEPEAGTTEAETTAESLAKLVAEYTLGRATEVWEIMKRRNRDDADGTAIDALNTAALLHGYGMVSLLRAFRNVDQAAADDAARDIMGAWEDGGSVHEFIADWAGEYGIPPASPASIERTPDHIKAAWTAKLAEPLPYSGETFEQLRHAIARGAYRGQVRFSEMAAELADADDSPWPPEKVAANLVAHGCSFYGWALLSVLSLLGKEFPALARRAAALVDDIGANGGCPHADDIPYPPTGEPTDATAGRAGEIVLTEKNTQEPCGTCSSTAGGCPECQPIRETDQPR